MSYQSPFKRNVWAHLWWYRTGRAGKPHSLPCAICSHPCPGPRCMTTIHDPYQVLCSFCRRSPNLTPPTARMGTVGVATQPDSITQRRHSGLLPRVPSRRLGVDR